MKTKEQKAVAQVRQVAASMAIEGMYFDEKFLEEMLMVAKGEKTAEEVRQAVIEKYKR